MLKGLAIGERERCARCESKISLSCGSTSERLSVKETRKGLSKKSLDLSLVAVAKSSDKVAKLATLVSILETTISNAVIG